MMNKDNWLDRISLPGKEKFESLFQELSLEDYLALIEQEPAVTRTAFQRLYDMIISYDCRTYRKFKKEIIHYNFFDDPFTNGKNRLFGVDQSLMALVNFFKSAAAKLGHDKRVFLLLGPVGSGKSTTLDLIKKGLEEYAKTEQGKLYAPRWVVHSDDEEGKRILGLSDKYEVPFISCPIYEEPLRLLPHDQDIRKKVIDRINAVLKENNKNYQVEVEGDACPQCRFYFNKFLERYKGDWKKVFREHLRVYRFILSEKDRQGIGTFQPVDEKNQDSSELLGAPNFRKLAEFGIENDPRGFNFRYGELLSSNRGLLEFVEVLKLDEAFLYPLLEASQFHIVKPKGFPEIDIDEVIIGHTNEAEYKKLQSNERMEAFKDRTIKINFPNVTTLSDEVKIYERDYSPEKIKEKHLAPHTIEMAALWVVLTRTIESKKVSLLNKVKINDGKELPGITEDIIDELRDEDGADREGMEGVSPRYVQDKLANSLIKANVKCINPFMLIGERGELESGLENHPLIGDKNKISRYKELLKITREEYESKVQYDVEKAVTGDMEAVKVLFNNYLDNLVAFVEKQKIKDQFTGRMIEADETLMRSIEVKLDPPEPENRKEDFRRMIVSKIGTFARQNKKFEFDSDERLRKALEKKLFEDRKDTIKLASITSSVVDEETRKKLDTVTNFLIEKLGYCEICARNALEFAASIASRGKK